jgi:excisionase family DNA binding protein
MSISFPEIMTIGETAQYLRISQSSLYKLAQDGRIPCQKVGRHWRFFKPAIQEWVASKNFIPTQPTTMETVNLNKKAS